MFGSKKSPPRVTKHNSVNPVHSKSNPFESDDLVKNGKNYNSSRRSSSDPASATIGAKTNSFDDDYDVNGNSSIYSHALRSSNRNKYKNDFRESGGIESQSVQELENYVVYKSEETTKSVNNCLKIAENMRDDAGKTLATLHQQGEQITRAHHAAADIDRDLSRGEKLLGSLGGMFSRTWKPKKAHKITGPVAIRDDPVRRKGNHLEQREKLGLSSAPKGQTKPRTPPSEPTNVFQKVEYEKGKQDDALSNISDILGELKGMAIDMGSELDKQNKAMDYMYKDVDELDSRMKGANRRGRHLLGK